MPASHLALPRTPSSIEPPTGSEAAGRTASWPLASVLVVDDEPGMRNFLLKTLETRAGQVMAAASAEEAEDLMRRHRFDLVILDITLPGKSGLELLRDLREQGNASEVVLITAFADLDTAIEALRAGAGDFLLKPFRVTQVLNAVRQGLDRARLKRENWVLRRSLQQRTPSASGLVGRSIVIKGLQTALQRVAAVDSTVLLTGESGTGKELAALALHTLSPHASAPFVPVNCAALSPALIEQELFGIEGGAQRRDGLFMYAQGGTLFLDEIGELPLPLQATLLRVLESRCVRPVGSEQEIPVNVRIVAASNRKLADEVEAGRFRKDLYYRLQVVEITLPPLRSHKEDIPDRVRGDGRRTALSGGVRLARQRARAAQPDRTLADPGGAQRLGPVPGPQAGQRAVSPSPARPRSGPGHRIGPERGAYRPADAGAAPHPDGAGVGGRRQVPGGAAAGRVPAHAGAPRGGVGSWQLSA